MFRYLLNNSNDIEEIVFYCVIRVYPNDIIILLSLFIANFFEKRAIKLDKKVVIDL